MIEKTMASGFMARHLLHWAKPENPTYDEFYLRLEYVDGNQQNEFLSQVRDMWIDLGNKRSDPKTITQ